MFRPKPPKRQVDPVRSSVVFLFRGVSSFPGPMDAEGRVTLFRRPSGTGLLLHRFCASRRCCRSSPAALQVAEQPGGCPLRDSGDAGKGGYGQGAGYTKLRHSFPRKFRAPPGEFCKGNWRSVEFWLASEGEHLPPAVRGSRLMQSMKGRPAKILTHLDVSSVAVPEVLR